VKDADSYHPFSKAKIPLDSSYFTGRVILTGKPFIIHDLTREDINLVISKQGVKSLLGVPIKLGDRIIGAIVVINKTGAAFNQEDSGLLSSIADIISLPIENARINDELRSSYEEIQSLNRAKDRIIEHLSHELRTPLAVLSASLGLLASNKYPDQGLAARILARSQRNLRRITEMQSKIIDITRNPDYRMHQSLSSLLELCTDALESVVDLELGQDGVKAVRRQIDQYFKPSSPVLKHIEVGPFVSAIIEGIKPRFAHRRLKVIKDISESAGFIDIPDDVLNKIVIGLIRNAVEYTPDEGKIIISVKARDSGPELTVTDTGVGITEENQQLIFGNYFTTADVNKYTTGRPYDFMAGGSGFDLLRIKVFSEQYNFNFVLQSYRCPHIPNDGDICPGSANRCSYCDSPTYCHRSGGTSFTIQFNT
jgi:signal transduction histidine kinase